MSQRLTEASVFLGHRIKHFFDDRLCLIQFYKIEKGFDKVSKKTTTTDLLRMKICGLIEGGPGSGSGRAGGG